MARPGDPSYLPSDELSARRQVPGIGTVELHYDITAHDGAFVTFETHFRFAPHDIVVASTTLRFMGRDELAGFLSETGFTDVTWFGNWDGAPITSVNPEIIAIAT